MENAKNLHHLPWQLIAGLVIGSVLTQATAWAQIDERRVVPVEVQASPASGSVQQVSAPQVAAPVVMKTSAVRHVGAATRQLMAAQAQGAQASPLQYSMPVDVATKVYERYLNSFTHEIPEHSGSALSEVRSQN